MWKGVLLASAIWLAGCEKPACQKLEAALCAPDIKNAVACEAGRSMARQSSNDECTEALSDLDTSVFLPPGKKPAPIPGLILDAPAPAEPPPASPPSAPAADAPGNQ